MTEAGWVISRTRLLWVFPVVSDSCTCMVQPWCTKHLEISPFLSFFNLCVAIYQIDFFCSQVLASAMCGLAATCMLISLYNKHIKNLVSNSMLVLLPLLPLPFLLFPLLLLHHRYCHHHNRYLHNFSNSATILYIYFIVWCLSFGIARHILIYQGVHCCTKVCDCQGSDTTWELRMKKTHMRKFIWFRGR